jgi:anti-sigma regulatory factor (Ser/Thr protein kinase)
MLSEWNMGHLVDNVQLILSELVTNAICHGAGPAMVCLRATNESLLIEVWDTLAASPEPRQHSADDEGGRGLEIVSGLSASWGCYYPESGGKVVWALVESRIATGG